MSRQSRQRWLWLGEDVEIRLGRLEKEVSELSDLTRSVKDTLDQFVSGEKTNPALSRSVIGVNYATDANPWAIEATKNITKTRQMRDWISSARAETYKRTLEALKSESGWLSAEKVGEITGRKRNTESTYLNRLFRAGLIKQKMDGNKTLYSIRDTEKLEQFFGQI